MHLCKTDNTQKNTLQPGNNNNNNTKNLHLKPNANVITAQKDKDEAGGSRPSRRQSPSNSPGYFFFLRVFFLFHFCGCMNSGVCVCLHMFFQ